MHYDFVLARYGEIALKGKNRPVFEGRLVANARRALREAGLPDEVRRTFGRILVPTDGEPRRVIEALGTVFGLVSMSPAVVVPAEPGAICEKALDLACHACAEREERPRTFKVETRRVDKRFPLSSIDVNRMVGAYLLEHLPGLAVDVHRPDLTVYVEIRHDGAYLYTDTWDGPGGLPVGTSGRALLLLSGGIDSPVAGWMGMKRGIDVAGVHFHSFPFTSERAKEKAIDLARVLSRHTGRFLLYLCNVTEAQKAIQRNVPEGLSITVLRRIMFRVAERLAEKIGALALLTGESVAQVASQTLESMTVIGAATRMQVLRPLVGLDKAEIVERARAIGTYEISIRPYEDCCTIFLPKNPRTRPRLAEVEGAEERLDIDGLIRQAVEGAEVMEL